MNHLRRTPTQQRSRERVEKILDAAASIVDADGPEALRVADIARRAGVPLGTVYQFFAGKDDLVRALAQRFADRFEEVLTSALTEMDTLVWSDVLDALLAAYVEHYRSEPGLRTLWVGARIDPEFIRADHEENNSRFARTLASLMESQATVDVDTLELMIFVCWEASQALLETAFRSHPDGDPAVIAQTTVLARRYLEPAFTG